MRNSHLPFTVSARRLAALHSTLDSWGCALAPRSDDKHLAELGFHLRMAQQHILAAILESKRGDGSAGTSARYAVACILYDGKPHSLTDISANVNMLHTHRSIQTYLADFVAEGWVRRIRNGVYQLIS